MQTLSDQTVSGKLIKYDGLQTGNIIQLTDAIQYNTTQYSFSNHADMPQLANTNKILSDQGSAGATSTNIWGILNSLIDCSSSAFYRATDFLVTPAPVHFIILCLTEPAGQLYALK